jgi:tRNA-2-methylthio-N6-dimethylallyladenosine synthase
MMNAYIETMGCQMNKYDSELVASILIKIGYELVANPNDADLILVNTCSVRKTAEDHAIGRLTQLGGLKYKNPALKIGAIGCMAERMQDSIRKQIPIIDLVVGPDA